MMKHPPFEEAVRFHGHRCPGLAIGYRMTRAALVALGVTRAGDEELVAVSETDACGVDALQWFAGCTFGKGNLIHRDVGKPVFTVFCRATGHGVRVLYHGNAAPADVHADRDEYIRWILNAKDDDVVTIGPAQVSIPQPARIHRTVHCEQCGEPVMETRLRPVGNRRLCIPCAELENANRNGAYRRV